jgi:hypothetical protein
MDARAISPNDCDTLTYEWTVIEGYGELTQSLRDAKINNRHGNIASIVPTKPGKYVIRLTINDHCNAPKTLDASFEVDCPGGGISMAEPVVEAVNQFTGRSDEIHFKDASQPEGAQGLGVLGGGLLGSSIRRSLLQTHWKC